MRGSVTLPEVRLFEQRVFRDARGTFAELWREPEAETSGLPRFVQDNVARSRRGVIRGLHFQNPRAQGKLVTVPLGEVFDVAVDVRAGSPTFGCWMAYTLSESNGRQLYIPPGFAHGYQTVSDVSVVVYKCSDIYSPDHEQSLRWNDDALGIEWPRIEGAGPLGGCLRREFGDRAVRHAGVRQCHREPTGTREILETTGERFSRVFVACAATWGSDERRVAVGRDLGVPSNDMREQDGERETVRELVAGSERVGTRVSRAEHRLFDRHSGEVCAQLHGRAGLDVRRVQQHAFKGFIEQLPGTV